MKKKTLPKFLEALKEKKTRLMQTHISYVLIGPKYTYKIKKHVKFPFVDYSTLAKRKYFCRIEVRLNRRYSPSVYLGVAPIKKGGKVIEYAVKMKTLPQSRRLDLLLLKNKITRKMMREIAREIKSFHSRARTSRKILSFGSPKHLLEKLSTNFREIAHFEGKALSKKLYGQLRDYLMRFPTDRQALFLQRLRDKRIKDLHGDLHSQNIFYHQKPYIFDCIEFNPGFRYIDVAAELSFLLMDLEFKNKARLAKELLNHYLKKSNDYALLALVDFYKCHYACVRGLVSCLEKKFKLANQYFKLAEKYAKTKPRLIAVGGIIGSGKSTLARKIKRQTGYVLLQSDRVRKELAGVPLFKRAPQKFYAPAFTQKTYQRLLEQAEALISKSKGVILDATWGTKKYRVWLMEMIKKNNLNYWFIETTAPKRVILKRLKARKHDISDADVRVFKRLSRRYEPPVEIPKEKRINVAAIKGKASTLNDALKLIR